MTQNTPTKTAEQIDLIELLEALLRKWYLILLAGILCGALGYFYTSYRMPETYQSTTTIYMYNQDVNAFSINELQVGNVVKNDYEVLVKSRTVLEAAIDQLNLNLSYGQVKGMISVNAIESTRMVEISAVTTDPKLSQSLVNTVTKISAKQIKEVMGIDVVNVVDEANLPAGKTGPDVRGNTKIAALAGAVLACALILLVHMTNNRICTQDDVESYLGLSTLGVIPMEKNLAKSQKKSVKKGKS